MKRLMILFATFLFLAFELQAQEIVLRSTENYGKYTTSTAVAGTTANNMDVLVAKDFMYRYEVQWAADSAGNGTDFTLQLQGTNDESNFYNIGSAVTWYVTTSDTIVRFTNYPSSETWTVASHTRVTAQTTNYLNGTQAAGADTSSTGVPIAWVNDDTITVAAATQTVAAQTYTIAKQYSVGWRALRLVATGGGSSAGCTITSFTVAIRRD